MSAIKPTPSANYDWHEFQDSDSLCENLSAQILSQLSLSIEQKGQAVLALSGGSTPKPLLTVLAHAEFDWSNVVVTLVDERWVPVGHEMSNAGMILDVFLHQLSIKPQFVPLFNICSASMDADSSRIAVLSDYCRLTRSTHAAPAPLDAVVLGMGGDGHTASFFPDAENISQLINPESPDHLLCCHTPSSQLPRITWSVPALLTAKFLALHISGSDKKAVFENAVADGSVHELPIRSMLFQDRSTLHTYYCD